MEVLGILDDVIPEHVAKMSHAERLKWHTDRIRRNEPVFMFLESLEHDMDEDELLNELLAVRYEMHQIRGELHLRSQPRFAIVRTRLAHAVAMMAHTLGNARKNHLQDALGYETEIRQMCAEVDLSPAPYLRLNQNASTSENTGGGAKDPPIQKTAGVPELVEAKAS